MPFVRLGNSIPTLMLAWHLNVVWRLFRPNLFLKQWLSRIRKAGSLEQENNPSVRQNKANSWRESTVPFSQVMWSNFLFKWCEATFYSMPLLPSYVLWFLRGLEVFDVIVRSWEVVLKPGCTWESLSSFKVTEPLAPLQNCCIRIFTNGVWLTVALKEFHRVFWFVDRVTRPCSGVFELPLEGFLPFPAGPAT